ncbi:hypothetical protein Godav_022868, partial [Gossypium davidsonii]|nr:hypothetical protein [Gossypium davidsonii]
VWSSITVDRELLARSGFCARGHYRPRVQIGPETHQRVDREMKYNCMLKIYLIRRNHSASYVGIPTVLEDIRLLLDQRLKVQIWHVKAPLVNYATMEMHQTDRVLWQFGF